jgi:hypothetical protein
MAHATTVIAAAAEKENQDNYDEEQFHKYLHM